MFHAKSTRQETRRANERYSTKFPPSSQQDTRGMAQSDTTDGRDRVRLSLPAIHDAVLSSRHDGGGGLRHASVRRDDRRRLVALHQLERASQRLRTYRRPDSRPIARSSMRDGARTVPTGWDVAIGPRHRTALSSAAA